MPTPIDPSMAVSFTLALALVEALKMTIGKINPKLNGKGMSAKQAEELHDVWQYQGRAERRAESQVELLRTMNTNLQRTVEIQNKTLEMLISHSRNEAAEHAAIKSQQEVIIRAVERRER